MTDQQTKSFVQKNSNGFNMLLAVDRYNYIVNGEAMASVDMFLKEDREFRDFMRVS